MKRRGEGRFPRPSWWSVEGIAAWLEEHPEALLVEMYRCAEAECGTRPAVLARDLSRMRARDPSFDDVVTEHVISVRGFSPCAGPPGADERLGPDWRERFAEALLASHPPSYERAAQTIGMTWAHLSRKANKERYPDLYDERWAEVLADCDAQLVARQMDNLNWGIERAREQDDPKVVINGSLGFLERRDRRNWSRQVEHTGRIDHVHGVDPGTARAMEQAALRSRRLFGGERAALPPGPTATIDAPGAAPATEAVEAVLVDD